MTCNADGDCKFGATCNRGSRFNPKKRCKCKWQTYQCSRYTKNFDGVILLMNNTGLIVPEEISYEHKTYCELAQHSCMIHSEILFNACYSEDEDDCFNDFISPGLNERKRKSDSDELKNEGDFDFNKRTFKRICQADTLSFCNYNGICIETLVNSSANSKGGTEETSHVIGKYCHCKQDYSGERCSSLQSSQFPKSENLMVLDKLGNMSSRIQTNTHLLFLLTFMNVVGLMFFYWLRRGRNAWAKNKTMKTNNSRSQALFSETNVIPYSASTVTNGLNGYGSNRPTLHLNGPNLAPSPRISRNVSPIPFQVLHRHSNSMPSATNLKIRSESFRLINDGLMNNQFESSNNLLGNDDVKFTIGVEEKKGTRSLTKNLTVK